MFLKRRLTEEKLQVDALDGLRGTAALLVVLSHTSNLNMFFVPGFDFRGTGKSGVFLFFLLSSFLLTRQMIIAADQFLRPSFWLLYWRRRFFRIYPFYFAYLALAIVTTHLSARMLGNGNHAQPFELDLAGLVRHLFLEESKGLTWSISVEFKFYFLLPFICGLFLLARGRGYLLSAIFLSLMVLSQVISPQSEAEPNSSRLLPYMPIFLSGIFLAFIHDRYQTQLVRFSAWLGAIGVAGVILMMPAVFSQMAGNVDGSYFHKQFLLHSAVWCC
jgi:peptidoglycan/LPS O-acetylase OafA/YrhL